MANKRIFTSTKYIRYSFIVAVNDHEEEELKKLEEYLRTVGNDIYGVVGELLSHDPIVFNKEEVSYEEFNKACQGELPFKDGMEI